MGFHQGEESWKAVEVIVTMVEVLDKANVRALESVKYGKLAFRLTEPAAVVIESNGATDSSGFIGYRHKHMDGRCDFLSRLRSPWCGILHRDPELGLNLVALKEVKDGPGVLVEPSGEPEPNEVDAMPLQGVHLAVEGRNVFRAPVVDETVQSHSAEHYRAFFRSAFAGIEGDDAPGH
jgi:hypothetical protein